MSEFTKEELKNLRACVDVCMADDGSDEILINKIQSMIDNYCEHEWHTNPYNYVLHCQKCGKTMKSDSQEKIINVNQ